MTSSIYKKNKLGLCFCLVALWFGLLAFSFRRTNPFSAAEGQGDVITLNEVVKGGSLGL